MSYTRTQLLVASKPLFQGNEPTFICEGLNQFITPKLLKQGYSRRELKNVIYITPHIQPNHRDRIIKHISNAVDRLVLVTPNRINCHWMKLMFNSTNAVCLFDSPPADVRGLQIKREWIALTFGINQAQFAEAFEQFGNFGSVVNQPSLERGDEKAPAALFELMREEVVNPAKPKPVRKTAQEVGREHRKKREKKPKPETQEALDEAVAEINQQIASLNAKMEQESSELEKLKLYRAVRSLQSKRSQFRKHFKQHGR